MKKWIILAVFMATAGLAAKPALEEGGPYFRIKLENGKYWFVRPDGTPFLSKGVNHILPDDPDVLPGSDYYHVSDKYPGAGEWARSVAQRLDRWKFNTVGSWSSPELYRTGIPFTVMLNFNILWPHRLKDVFDPSFQEKAAEEAKTLCAPFVRARNLVGYYLDNELPWYGGQSWNKGDDPTLLDEYMSLGPEEAGKAELVKFFRSRYRTIADLNRKWKTAFRSFSELQNARSITGLSPETRDDREQFTGLVADRYFKVLTAQVRSVDPNHLVLGVRFAGDTPLPVIRACGKYCDVISLNYYSKGMTIDKKRLDNFYFTAKKPLLLTEFSYRATENSSGNANTKGADVTVPTQKDRAEGYRLYVRGVMSLPYVVGYHWFQYNDQSPQGRSFDGENSDYGIVDIQDREYVPLVEAMIEMNQKADAIHRETTNTLPDRLQPGANAVSVEGGDARPGARGQFVDLGGNAPPSLQAWGDTANGAFFKIQWISGSVPSRALRFTFRAGRGWGAGFTVFPNTGVRNADGTADLTGFSGLELDMKASSEMRFNVFISESGADEVGKKSYPGVRGADGESFTSESLVGSLSPKTVRIPFASMRLRTLWGNQSGNKTINLTAIRSIDIYVAGPNDSGEFVITSFRLY